MTKPHELDEFDELLEEIETEDEGQEDVGELDDGFSELEAIIAEATAKSAEERRLKQLRKRLVHISKHEHATKEEERLALLAEIRKLEEGRVWTTVGAVALFHSQECGVCQTKHEFFVGWFTDQRHISDPNSRRLVRGKPVERLPQQAEYHPYGVVEACSNCIESQLAIDIAVGNAPGEL